jgi:hypothetical protein
MPITAWWLEGEAHAPLAGSLNPSSHPFDKSTAHLTRAI